MSVVERVKTLVTWPPPQPGEEAPRLSLTADEGTWIRLPDFKGHINVVLVFFKSLTDDAVDAWLKDFQKQRQRFEDLETALFGVSTARTDKLREFRSSLGLEFYLLYDPLGVEARGFRAASRWRPSIKNQVVIVGKDGKVAWSERGLPSARAVLEQVARLQGVSLDPEVNAATSAEEQGFSAVRNPGQKADIVKNIESVQAATLLRETDSPYILLDVRTLSEFEADHAPGAVHIPVDELPHRYQELGQTTHIICICQAGGRSALASEFLTSIGGSHIHNVIGGMSGWSGERVTGGLRS